MILQSEHQRIGGALEILRQGLFPFFEQELRLVYGERWEEVARTSIRNQVSGGNVGNHWDIHAILSVMWEQWNNVFRNRLGLAERSLVSELREFRNKWAHQTPFTEDDSYRVLDSVQRLLMAIEADDFLDTLEDRKIDVLRNKLGRRVNEELARIRFNRARMADVAIYASCCAAIVALLWVILGNQAPLPTLFISCFTTFSFGYFIYQRVTATVPTYGVHECPKCSKVIYSEVCPYCDPPIRSSSILHTGSSLRIPRSADTGTSVSKSSSILR